VLSVAAQLHHLELCVEARADILDVLIHRWIDGAPRRRPDCQNDMGLLGVEGGASSFA
jgi:hypothetical protein